MNKKLLSILISIVMVGTMIAVPAFATETAEKTEKQEKALGVDDFTIMKGAEHRLEPKVDGAEEGDYTFEYKSDDTAVASVDAEGKVTAVTEGDATITITAKAKKPAGETATETENEAAEGTVEKPEQEGEGGSSETPSATPSEITQDVKVTVLDSVEITCSDLTLAEEETGNLEPSVKDEVNYTFSFEAAPADTDIIKVDNEGNVEGLKPGKAAVNVRVNGIIGAEKEVTVKKVTVTVTSGHFYGLAFEIPDPMPAEFTKDDFGEKVFAYKYLDSNNEEVITFDKSEVAEEFRETADLTDKFLSGEIQVWEVYKYKKKTRNLMNLKDMTLTYGDNTVNLKDKALNKDAEFTFSSGNDRVVDVDSEGNIETVASGEAEITITCTDTKYYREQEKKIKVTVKKADQTIEGDSSVTKYVGDNYFDINASAMTPIEYNSSNKKVATVDKGKVTINAAGTALITLDTAGDDYCYNSASKTIKVTVKKPYATTLSVKALSGKDKKKIRLTWKPVKGASKYQIYVYNTKKTVTVKTSSLVGSHQDKYGNFYYTHTKLKAGKTYKYKVRAISYSASGKAYYGPYSSAKSAKAKRK